MSWPPKGLDNPDALADIYNVFFSEAKKRKLSDTDAHQFACEKIHEMGWWDGHHVGRYEAAR